MRGLSQIRTRLTLTTLVLVGLIAPAVAGAVARPQGGATAGPRPAATRTKTVRYHGYRLVVPASWPVFDLTADPTACVRFDRHAVYLGRPTSRQRCPAHAVGRTEAILVAPLAAHGAGASVAATAPALPPIHQRGAEPSRGGSTERAVPSAGVLVTATWSGDPAAIKRALGVKKLSPSVGAPTPAHAAQARPRATHRAGDPVYTGLGFDACSTPSSSAMSAWGASPYRAVGIYIGGANEACAQPNLSATWVSQESAGGWVLLPIYVGLQAPSNGCARCASIVASQASAEGTAAADDAVNQAQAVGIGPGNPLYDDMENYSPGAASTPAVLAFLSAWTTELHNRGYLSGVYSSARSGITDLVAQVGTGYVEPDQIWVAEWNGQQSTNSGYVPAADWPNHQRLHQYQGGHNATYGGVTINIDSDYVDAGAASGGSFPNGTFVQVAGTTTVWEIAGGAPLYVSDWGLVGGAQPYTVITQQQFNALNPVPANGTLFQTNTGATYVVAGGAPMYVTSTALLPNAPQPVLVDEWNVDNAGNPTSHLNALPANGTFLTTTTGQSYRVAGGAPIAVTTWSAFGGAQPSVVVDAWDIANIFNPIAHLVYRPAVGTVVQGLPSGAYWQFGPKNRFLVTPSPGAVRVDNRGLVPFSAIPCRVPTLAHKTLAQVKKMLMSADCHLGKVHTHVVTKRRHVLRVIKQIPLPRTKHVANYAVGITLG